MKDSKTDVDPRRVTSTRLFSMENYISRINGISLRPCYLLSGTLVIILIIIVIVKANFKLSSSNIDYNEISGVVRGKIVICNNDSFWTFMPATENLTALYNTKNPIGAFDVYTENEIFWNIQNGSEIFTLPKKPKKIKDKNIEILFKEIRSKPRGMAIDFISGNLYVIDNLMEALVVIDTKTKNYTLLLMDLDSPLEIVLDPAQGLMFILQRNDSILRGGMDGSSLNKIISCGSISTMTLDYRNKRIYWIYNQVIIESSDYNGNERKSLLSDSEDIVSLSFLNGRLFWLWHQRTDYAFVKSLLWSCKIVNASCEDHVMYQINSLSNVGSIRAAPEVHSNIKNPCVDEGDCQDLCLLSPGGGRKCTCSLGRKLNPDGKTCREVSEFMLFTWGDLVRGVQPDSPESEVFWPNPYHVKTLKKGTVDFDYDIRNDDFYFSDDSHIYRMKLRTNNPTKQELLLTSNEDMYVEDMALDWIGGNLYYSLRSKIRSKDHSLMVLSVKNTKFTKRLQSFTYDPTLGMQGCAYAVAVDPGLGNLLFTAGDDGSRYIMRTSLNGTKLSQISNVKVVHEFRLLTIDFDTQRVYWISGSHNVEHARLDGSDRQSLHISEVVNARTIAVHRRWIYLSTNSSVWRVRKSDGQGAETIAYTRRKIAGVRIVSSSLRVPGESSCELASGGCEQFCFPGPKVTCDCKDGQRIKTDGHCAV